MYVYVYLASDRVHDEMIISPLITGLSRQDDENYSHLKMLCTHICTRMHTYICIHRCQLKCFNYHYDASRNLANVTYDKNTCGLNSLNYQRIRMIVKHK